MAYINIKDRVALGDDKFIMTDLGGGRIQLVPDPDSITEAGTDINKALLQPAVDGGAGVGMAMKNGIIDGFVITPPQYAPSTNTTVTVGVGTCMKNGVALPFAQKTHTLAKKTAAAGESKGIFYTDGTSLFSAQTETSVANAVTCYPNMPVGSILLARYTSSIVGILTFTEMKQYASVLDNYGTQAYFNAEVYRTENAARAMGGLIWSNCLTGSTEELILKDSLNMPYSIGFNNIVVGRTGRYNICVQLLSTFTPSAVTMCKLNVFKTNTAIPDNLIGGGYVTGVYLYNSLVDICNFDVDLVAGNSLMMYLQTATSTSPPVNFRLYISIRKIANPANPNER